MLSQIFAILRSIPKIIDFFKWAWRGIQNYKAKRRRVAIINATKKAKKDKNTKELQKQIGKLL